MVVLQRLICIWWVTVLLLFLRFPFRSLWCVLVWIVLSSCCLGFVGLLGSADLCIPPNLGCFHFIISSNMFLLFHSCFLLDPSNTNVRPFMIVPRVSELLFILLHLSFYCLDWIIPVDQLSSSLTLFLLCYLHSALEPIQWAFSLLLYFSDLRFPFDLSPYSLISFLRLSSLTFVVTVFVIFPIVV